jgi:hypothetical protein
MGIGQPGVDEGLEAGFPEVGHGLAVPPLVDVDGDELAARLAQGPGDPDARVPGRGADLEGPGALVLEDEVVEDAAVGFGHVHVAPAAGVGVEEGLDLAVQVRTGLAAGTIRRRGRRHQERKSRRPEDAGFHRHLLRPASPGPSTV